MTDEEKAEKEIKISRLKEAIANEHTQFLETRAKLEKQLDFNISLGRENTELKKQISVLLSCANCPENKGGYICEKEYNDKCLAQKIEYIKELTEENAELSNSVTELTNSVFELENKVTELNKQIEKMKSDVRINIKWADYEKNNQMWQKLIKMINEWS